jgi:hypothetical protein
MISNPLPSVYQYAKIARTPERDIFSFLNQPISQYLILHSKGLSFQTISSDIPFLSMLVIQANYVVRIFT